MTDLRIGTSAFTAAGWAQAFYYKEMNNLFLFAMRAVNRNF